MSAGCFVWRMLVGAALMCSGLVVTAVAADRVVHVVLPDQPVDSVTQAGDELENYLAKATGYRVVRVSSSAWKVSQKPAIVLGVSPANVASKPFARDGYTLQAVADDVLHMWGSDAAGAVDSAAPKGTLYGVYDYLKQDCGVRWLFPGPLGEVVPNPPVPLKIRGVNRSSAPSFDQRLMTTGGWLEVPDDLKAKLNRTEKFDQQLLRQHRVWMMRNRLSTKRLVDANHAFVDWWEKYHDEHPDWFAMHRNGKRDLITKTHMVKLCTTNPEVIRETVAQGLTRLGNNPWMKSISASPNDSSLTGFCMCPNCRKLDAPDAIPFTLRDKQGNYQYPAMTDRHVIFWNQVAIELSKQRRDLLVGGYAYGSAHTPPVKVKPLPNVLIGYVQHAAVYWDIDAHQEERECFNKWTRHGGTFLWRPNSLQIGHGIPTNFIWRLSNDIENAQKRGARYVSYDSLGANWGSLGHIYYFLAERLWDVDKPVPEIWKEYLQAAYGPAREPMRAYFAELEAIGEGIFHSRQLDAVAWRQGGEIAAVQAYSETRWARLKQLLTDARAKSANYAMGLRMLDMHDEAMEFFELQLAVNRKLYDRSRPIDFSKGSLAEAIAARDAWLASHPRSLAVSTAEVGHLANQMQRVAASYVPSPRGKLEVDE